MRSVTSESRKWRSGRVSDRMVSVLCSGRGGERSHVVGDQEGVAGKYDADVVVPAYEGSVALPGFVWVG